MVGYDDGRGFEFRGTGVEQHSRLGRGRDEEREGSGSQADDA
jgi:hypothetical protein